MSLASLLINAPHACVPHLVAPLGVQRQEAVVPVAAQADGPLEQVRSLQRAPGIHLRGVAKQHEA